MHAPAVYRQGDLTIAAGEEVIRLRARANEAVQQYGPMSPAARTAKVLLQVAQRRATKLLS